MTRCKSHFTNHDIRTLYSNTSIQEEFLLCEPIITITKAVFVFDILNSFIIANDLEWIKLILLITDGKTCILGIQSVLIKRIKDKSPEVIIIYCLISLSQVI